MTPHEIESQIRKILVDFQIGDLKKGMALAKANFLVAIGLMTATEFLGGLITGTLGQNRKSECRFEAGLRGLGREYELLLTTNKDRTLDLYKNIRCGLVHQYLPSQTRAVVAGKTGGPGIVVVAGQLELRVDDYIRDLEQAAQQLLQRLSTDSALLQNCRDTLRNIPHLE